MNKEASPWTIADSLETYQVQRWGNKYFGINKTGELCVYPSKQENAAIINIQSVINEVKKEGIQLPAVFRFHDILRSQVIELNESFNKVIDDANYQGRYLGVFPVKVNQLREVVEEIIDAGKDFQYGLEAGSKPELLAALAYNTTLGSLTILNGHKDSDYIKLAMLGTKVGKNIVIVIEKFSEIFNVLRIADEFEVAPSIGVRAKLTSKSSGKWSESSGEQSKFGLSVTEILELVELLKSRKQLHLLNLFHFHVGSQIPDIRTIKECLIEGAQIYANLVQMGVKLQYFDVGGGVGIDYDATQSNTLSSTNYKLHDYIVNVVSTLKEVCDQKQIKHPDIVSETGRGTVAHHSCVITNVLGSVNLTKPKSIESQLRDDEHPIVKKIKIIYNNLSLENFQDAYNDACMLKDEAISAFKLGVFNLKERSISETLYWNICHKIIHITKDEKYLPEEIQSLISTLSDKYLCNFSLFQSAPDVWAIEQILPILPISRHLEEPTIECTLADITCDSDGKINNFLSPNGHNPTLKVHPLTEGEDYFIGLFLTGAYQDVMGDMHNLFGRLNEVHIFSDTDDPNGFYIEEVIKGNSCADVLQIMQYSPLEMSRKIKNQIDQQVKKGRLKPRVGVKLIDFYEKSLKSYTYLRSDSPI